MQTFDSYAQLRETDKATYKLIGKLGSKAKYHYRSLPNGGEVWDMQSGNQWNIAENPDWVTDAQWRTFALRILNFDSLRSMTLQEVIANFHYDQKIVVVGVDRFYLPSGTISGWLQGMFMSMDAEGNINT